MNFDSGSFDSEGNLGVKRKRRTFSAPPIFLIKNGYSVK